MSDATPNPHVIYTQPSGASLRGTDILSVPAASVSTSAPVFLYYNKLASRVIAERDGTLSFLHAHDATQTHTVRVLCGQYGQYGQ
jgi:hypothetical protein